MKKTFTTGMLFMIVDFLSKRFVSPLKSSVGLFAFSGVFWILAAFINRPVFLAHPPPSFTNPGVLTTPPTLWLKADADANVIDGRVSYWRDQSGNSNHAYQSSSSKRPAWRADFLNFNPVLFCFDVLKLFV